MSPLLSERSSLEKVHYASIDSVLKDLKVLSRQLTIMATALSEETQILDRIHYKNRDQHRSALFSRRVSELRRYSRRVEDFQVCDLLADLRQCFFGQTNSKQMKGPWTHYPDKKYVLYMKKQLSSFLELLKKMYTISLKAFESFSLAMQTGAFVQLLLTLIAIASRMASLISEMSNILQLVLPVISNLLQIFDPPALEKVDATTPEPLTVMPTGSPRSKSVDIEVQVKRPGMGTANTGERPRKKKKVKDEIDNIFGF